MTIRFDCSNCGKRYALDDELAGRRAFCKKCGSPITIPQPSAALMDGVAVGDSSSGDSHADASRMLNTHDTSDSAMAQGSGTHAGVEQASTPTPGSPEPRKPDGEPVASVPARLAATTSSLRRVGPGGIVLGALLGLLLLLCLSVAMTPAVAPVLGLVAGLLAVLLVPVMLVIGGWLAVLAFRESVGAGVMFLLLPFFNLYYAVTRWRRTYRPVCYAILAVTPMLWLGVSLASAARLHGQAASVDVLGLDLAMLTMPRPAPPAPVTPRSPARPDPVAVEPRDMPGPRRPAGPRVVGPIEGDGPVLIPVDPGPASRRPGEAAPDGTADSSQTDEADSPPEPVDPLAGLSVGELASRLTQKTLRDAAVERLIEAGPEAEEAVRPFLFRRRPEIRIAAMRVLEGIDASGSAESVVMLLADPTEEVSESAKRTLEAISPRSLNDVTLAVADLRSGVADRQLGALQRLTEIPVDPTRRAEVTDELRQLARTRRGDDRLRAAALAPLMRWDEQAAAIVEPLAEEAPLPVRRAALRAIASEGPTAIARLTPYLADDDVRDEAKSLLAGFGEMAERAVLAQLRSPDPRVRLAAVELLGDVGSATSIGPLRRLATSRQSAEIAAAARVALETIAVRRRMQQDRRDR